MHFETLAQSRAKPLLLPSSRVGHAARNEAVNVNELTPPKQVVHDLPSWTPLKVQENNGTQIPDDDLFLLRKETSNSAIERHRGQHAQATTDSRDSDSERAAATVGRTLKPPSDAPAPPPKRSKVRFDGVLISTKPPSYRKPISSPKPTPTITSAKPRPVGGPLSLVDALSRTFNANKYTEASGLFYADAQRRPHDDASTAGQTDAETGTEAENEELRLNTRLARPGPPSSWSKKRHALTRTSRVNDSGSNSEDAGRSESRVSRLRQVGLNHELGERPAKRLKAIQYESNTKWIDAALGTVEASIRWDAGLYSNPATEVKDEVVSPEHTPVKVRASSSDAPMAVQVDGSDQPPVSSSPGESRGSVVSVSTPEPAANVTTPLRSNAPYYTGLSTPKRLAVLSPYKSRGAKFRQRLADAFGTDTVVRTDKSARPRSMLVDHDNYYPMLDSDVVDDRVQSPAPSETTTSSSVVSVPGSTTTPEEGAEKSARITSLSPGDVPAKIQLNDTDSVTTPSPTNVTVTTAVTEPTGDEQICRWIVALQRLVKGKVRVKEEDLETLSIILAEVESVKGSLDASISMTSELRQSIQQLSQLHEIPFGDRNRLRRRAANMLHAWPLTGKLDHS